MCVACLCVHACVAYTCVYVCSAYLCVSCMYVWYVCVVYAFVSCAYVRACGAYLCVRVRGAYTCMGVSMSRGEMQTDIPWDERKLSLSEPEMDALNDKIL